MTSNRIFWHYSFFFILCAAWLSPLTFVQAVDNEGGVVQTTGSVVFVEAETSTSETKELPQTSGQYPLTGEFVMQGLSIVGLLVVVVVLSILWIRRKARVQNNE